MKFRRRTFIRSTGIALALPRLDVFADDARSTSNVQHPPRRMICICAPLGLHPDHFFPQDSGRDYALSPYLEVLKPTRRD